MIGTTVEFRERLTATLAGRMVRRQRQTYWEELAPDEGSDESNEDESDDDGHHHAAAAAGGQSLWPESLAESVARSFGSSSSDSDYDYEDGELVARRTAGRTRLGVSEALRRMRDGSVTEDETLELLERLTGARGGVLRLRV